MNCNRPILLDYSTLGIIVPLMHRCPPSHPVFFHWCILSAALVFVHAVCQDHQSKKAMVHDWMFWWCRRTSQTFRSLMGKIAMFRRPLTTARCGCWTRTLKSSMHQCVASCMRFATFWWRSIHRPSMCRRYCCVDVCKELEIATVSPCHG